VKIAVNTLPLLDNRAGAERYTQNIIRHLIAADPRNVYYLVLSRVNQTYYGSDQGTARNLVWGGNTRNRLIRILGEQVYLPRLVRKKGIDLLFSPCNIGPRNPPVPLVITLFDLHWLRFPELFSPLRLAYLRRALTWSVRKAAAVLTISENSKKDLIHLLSVPEEKITVTYVGLDPLFRKVPEKSELLELHRRFGLKGRFILSVGQLHKRKNIPGLLQAYRRLAAHAPLNVQLVIAGGEGDGAAEVRETVRRIGRDRVVFTGCLADEDLLRFYHAAECLVYPSFYEGFGLPVLEAILIGRRRLPPPWFRC
jgi:glycosyltransferase involved in cell wall biosynthesis